LKTLVGISISKHILV